MAQSVKSKKILNMVYGLGASIVLIGALFKILHFHIGFLTGGVMLTIGLLTSHMKLQGVGFKRSVPIVQGIFIFLEVYKAFE
jgi:hypothetical protein